MKPWILALACCSLLSGCAIMGRQQKDQALVRADAERVAKGMSRAEVVEILGAPHQIEYIREANDPVREHAYVYEHVRTKYTAIALAFVNFGNSDEKRDRVVVFFDPDGKVAAVGKSFHADESSFGFPFGK